MPLLLRHITPHIVKNHRSGDFATNIYQKNDDIIVKMHVPGIHPDKIDISIEDNLLYIRGEREEEHETEDTSYFHREIRTGAFERIVTLPMAVDQAGIKAEYKHGVLKIFLPKKQTQEKIKVSVKEE